MAELYQIVGAILRDVSQARFLSDLYSRQISFTYESDSLLRRFPVPRGEISEVEFNLPFVVTGVRVDKDRHQSRNAAVGRIFDDYSLRIVRAGLGPVQTVFDGSTKGLSATETEKKAAADRFEARILSDEARNTFHGRLLRFLNEETESLLPKDEGGPFHTDPVRTTINNLVSSVQADPVVKTFEDRFAVTFQGSFDEARTKMDEPLTQMGARVLDAMKKYPDYAVDVSVGPDDLKNSPAASYIKVKAVVKNYRWSKVDVDSKEMRNLRSLVPE